MDMGQHTFMQTLEAYQADLDTNAAITETRKGQANGSQAASDTKPGGPGTHDWYANCSRTPNSLASHPLRAKVCASYQGHKIHAGKDLQEKIYPGRHPKRE